MQIVINDLSNGKRLCRRGYPAEFISSKGMEEVIGNFFHSTGKVSFNESWFEGMRILIAEFDSAEVAKLEIESDRAFYTMVFSMEGSIKLITADALITLPPNRSIFIRIQQGKASCELDKYGKVICIQFTERCYNRLTNNEETYSITASEPVLRIQPAMHMILRSLGESTQSTSMRRIFQETGVLQLLMLLLGNLPLKHSSQRSFLKEHDIERIHYAKSIIEEDIQNPCSLIELAHKAGLNDFKLKKGFKELFGITVFGYLHEVRMEKAKKMLEEKRTVNDVSHQVGYKNPHHFSAAFKKKFGIQPGQLNK